MQNGDVNGEDDEEYRLFLALHTPALKAARIPPLYWRSLHLKLTNEVNIYITVNAINVNILCEHTPWLYVTAVTTV